MYFLMFGLGLVAPRPALAGEERVDEAAPATPAVAPLKDTTDTLEKWVEARQVIARTKRDWQADKETLLNTIELFQKESALLADKLRTVGTDTTHASKEIAEFEAGRATLEEGLDQARALVEQFEIVVSAMAIQFPSPLYNRIEPLLKRIPSDPQTTKRTVMERMQNIVGLINEVDKFNTEVTVVSEVQKNPEGKEVQVQTIYLGLGQAYFVDKTGGYAGFGAPSDEGWKWTSRLEMAAVVQKVIAIYDNQLPAAFVGLPVRIH